MKRFWLFSLLLFPIICQSQVIITIAGTGSSVYSGNNVPATDAGIPNPGRGVFDKSGNYYFVDAQNSHRVRKITPAGIISNIAGNGIGGYNSDNIAATTAKLYLPQGVALDTFGNVYIADAGNNRIRRVDAATGIITTVVGTGTGSFTGDSGLATAATIWDPQDVCIDKSGNLYIADGFNDRVRKVDTHGIITTFAGNGNSYYSGDGCLADTSRIGLIVGLCTDTVGNIYMGSNTNCRVFKVNTSGIISTVAGTGNCTYSVENVLATTANICPLGLTCDKDNNLFIADRLNNWVYEVDNLSELLTTVVGNGIAGDIGDYGPATAAELYEPSGVAFDPCGNLYIPTIGSSVVGSGRRIRKVIFDSTCILSIDSASLATFSIKVLGQVAVYPNPTSNILQIDNITVPTSYCLQNIVGAILQQGTLQKGSNTLSLNALPTGMYMLQLTDEQGGKVVKKIIKE